LVSEGKNVLDGSEEASAFLTDDVPPFSGARFFKLFDHLEALFDNGWIVCEVRPLLHRAVISKCRHLVLSCEAGSQGNKCWWSEWRVKHLQFRPAHSVINHYRRRQRPRIHVETFNGLRLVVFKNDEIFFRE